MPIIQTMQLICDKCGVEQTPENPVDMFAVFITVRNPFNPSTPLLPDGHGCICRRCIEEDSCYRPAVETLVSWIKSPLE